MSNSEVSVSTSTSSRIRQFGLYRTIDARTEEFLRLSRKRQIKQGCACAAISTAITVTVVITVFLVYMEYGMNTDANPQSLGKAGWIGLLNDSLASSFEEKFSKSKINFDRNTIRLLPLIIKALKQNRYLEKIIEDYSSPSPVYDGKVTTEFTFKKDIFLNTKNWKKPSSRLYTIEYKTSPIVFLKNPTKEPGYFTKNRKIRDYKRIMGYVEKMINDKVGLGYYSTVPIKYKKPEAQTNIAKISQKMSKPKPKSKFIKKQRNPNEKTPKKKDPKPKQNNIVSCKCPKQLSLILEKIFSNIQQLIPNDKITKSGPCSGDQGTSTREANPNITVDPLKTKLLSTTTSTTSSSNLITSTAMKKKSIPVKFSEFDNVYYKETTVLPETSTQPMPFKYSTVWKVFEANKNTHMFNNEDTTVQANSSPAARLPFFESRNILQANYFKRLYSLRDSQITNPDVHDRTTTVYDHIEPTEAHYETTIITQPISSTIDIMERERIQTQPKSSTIDIMEREQIQTHPSPSTIDIMEREQIQTQPSPSTTDIMEIEQIHSTTTTTEKNFNQKSNYVNENVVKKYQYQNLNSDINKKQLQNKINDRATIPTTTHNILHEIIKFGIHSFELLKSKLLSPNKRLNLTLKNPNSFIDDDYTSSSTEGSIIDRSTTSSGTTQITDEESTMTSRTEEPITSTQKHVQRYIFKTISNDKSTETNKNPKSINVKYAAIKPININENATNKSTEKVTTNLEENKQEPFYLGLDNIALEEEIEKIARNDEYQDELSSNRRESATQLPATVKNSTTALKDSTETDVRRILKNKERIFSPSSMLPQYRPTYLEIHRGDWIHEDNKDYDTDYEIQHF